MRITERAREAVDKIKDGIGRATALAIAGIVLAAVGVILGIVGLTRAGRAR